MPIWPHQPEHAAIAILLDSFSPAERRGLANAPLCAAWSATLSRRVALPDAVVAMDHNIFGDAL